MPYGDKPVTAPFKVCCLCERNNRPRARRCWSCHEKPVFRQPTQLEVQREEERRERDRKTISWLLATA